MYLNCTTLNVILLFQWTARVLYRFGVPKSWKELPEMLQNWMLFWVNLRT